MGSSRGEELSRRELLGVLGVAGLAAWTGRLAAEPGGGSLERLDCVVTAAQTEGPYFVDERLQRRDLRLDPVTQLVSEGVPLRLGLQVSRVDGRSCAPLSGAQVDVWQCDATGVYSDVRDRNGFFDTRGKQFLRGYQVTDRNGAAEFLTVYPGWYSGRTVHLHFKVRVPSGHQFTSQLYFDDALTDRVHGNPPYNRKGARDTRNGQDGIFRESNSGAGLVLRLTPEGRGYQGDFSVGLRMT